MHLIANILCRINGSHAVKIISYYFFQESQKESKRMGKGYKKDHLPFIYDHILSIRLLSLSVFAQAW